MPFIIQLDIIHFFRLGIKQTDRNIVIVILSYLPFLVVCQLLLFTNLNLPIFFFNRIKRHFIRAKTPNLIYNEFFIIF